MGQVFIRFGKAGAPSRAGGVAQIFDAFPQTEEVTSSGTSQATTITAQSNDMCRVSNNGSNTVWVTFGESPTAAVGTGHPVVPNSIEDIGPIGENMKAAVIDDS